MYFEPSCEPSDRVTVIYSGYEVSNQLGVYFILFVYALCIGSLNLLHSLLMAYIYKRPKHVGEVENKHTIFAGFLLFFFTERLFRMWGPQINF
jgi:hypothetical protein